MTSFDYLVVDEGTGRVYREPPGSELPHRYLVLQDGTDRVYYKNLTPGSDNGGPDGGQGGTGTYRYPVNEPIQISDDYNEHVARNSGEPGTDFYNAAGTPVFAVESGVIRLVKRDSSTARGRVVELNTNDGAYFAYLHLQSIWSGLTVGSTVTRGQYLGAMGGSGYGVDNYYGVHLHLTMWTGPTTTRPPYNQTVDFELYL